MAISFCELLGKLFSYNNIDDFVIRLLSLKFQHVMDQKGGPSCLLSSLKCDKLSYAHLEKIINPNPQKPLAKNEELKAFFTIIDVDCDGVISLEDLQNIYQEPTKPSLLKIITSVQFSLVKYKQARLVASCPILLSFTAKRLTHVKSETAVISQYFVPTNSSAKMTFSGFGMDLEVYINVLMLIRGNGIDLFMKPPTSFKVVWKDQIDPNLVLWEPEAPTGYSSLGLVATTGNQPPRTSIHCIPTKWLESLDKYDTIALDGFDSDNKSFKLTLYLANGVLSLTPPMRLMYDNFALQQDFFDDSNIPAILPL